MGCVVNIDGTLSPPEQAFVSVFDRGFLYGDSVYEVLRTYQGAPFELDAHLDRLENSAALIGLDLTWPREEIVEELRRTVAVAGNAESYARIVITRGSGEIGLDPSLARIPRLVIIAKELITPPPEAYERGVKVALVAVRRNLREAIDPAAKTGNYLNSVLAMKQAREKGAFEALMLDKEGRITEAASANVFVVKAGTLFTPPLAGILEGVTRGIVLKLARAAWIPLREQALFPDDLLKADEVFITGTTRELVPVVTVAMGAGDLRIGDGRPGRTTRRLLADFRARARATSGG